MPQAEPRIILLAGASGLAGTCTLSALLEAPEVGRVYAVTRRPLRREHPRLANRIVQFDHLEAQLKGATCHAALCCLGTTLRAAGSEEAARRVEIEYVLAFARAAKSAQAQRFAVLSCVGADPAATDLRLRMKGEMEEALTKLGFASLDILQPGALIGSRGRLEAREAARLVLISLINPFLTGPREPRRSVPAQTIGAAMLGTLRSGRRGVQRYTYSGIQALAKLKPVKGIPASSQNMSPRA